MTPLSQGYQHRQRQRIRLAETSVAASAPQQGVDGGGESAPLPAAQLPGATVAG
jgi:hypothetical protein